MYIIVGLGNPGIQYAEQRHNVGFKVIDLVAANLKIDVNKNKFKGLIGEGTFENEKIVLIKPQTFMNLSGECVAEAINWYKVPTQNLIIIYDDIDLPLGKIRIRQKGSSGTHNGMRSIVEQIGSEDFPRVRIGIGRPDIKGYDLADFVLGKFLPEQRPSMEEAYKNAGEIVKTMVRDGIAEAMNKFN